MDVLSALFVFGSCRVLFRFAFLFGCLFFVFLLVLLPCRALAFAMRGAAFSFVYVV